MNHTHDVSGLNPTAKSYSCSLAVVIKLTICGKFNFKSFSCADMNHFWVGSTGGILSVSLSEPYENILRRYILI